MQKGDKLLCEYITGGGTKHSHGIYTITMLTEKQIRLKIESKAGLSSGLDDNLTIYINPKGVRRNSIKEITKDGFICYCNKQGIPFIFTLL